MRSAFSALAFTLIGFFIGAAFFIAASLVLAWTGPTSAPPNGNVSAPINVGTTDQIKNAGLGINSLAVFGNTILAGVSSYLNFGPTAGSSGYGFRDNAGVLEFKDGGGSWSSFLPATGVQSIIFADGTTQTTAASAGGATEQTTTSCNITVSFAGSYSCTTPNCSVDYVRSGCSAADTTTLTNRGSAAPTAASPSGTAACTCKFAGSTGYLGSGATGACYTYCVH